MLLQEIYRLSAKNLKEAGIESSEIDARILICHGLKISPEKFFVDAQKEVSPAAIEKIKLLIKKRAQNIPVAYLVGEKDFFGLSFSVDKNVLIPRPETEYLVELAINRIKNHESRIKDNNSIIHNSKFLILDMGTGSGNIIISLAKNVEADFFACDLSLQALALAQQNARTHRVEQKIKFYESDLFSNPKLNQKFDLIIANLPYVPKEVKSEESILFEPPAAIFADDHGADIIKRFLEQAPNYLNDQGEILIELDPRNGKDLEKFAQEIFPHKKIRLEKDLAGFLRYLIIQSNQVLL